MTGIVAVVAVAAILAGCGGTAASDGTATSVATAQHAPAGTSRPAPTSGLCVHGVPGDVCTRCTPELAAVFKEMGDWCEHDLPRSQCTTCNPGLDLSARAVPNDWCAEHAVPESMCTLCHPDLVAKFVAAGDYCRVHGYPQSVCPRCNPHLVAARGEVPPQFPAPGTKVRLASAETAKEVGLRTVVVQSRRTAHTLDVIGRVDFDQYRLAELSARSEAVILEVAADIGDDVQPGQSLLMLASAAVGAEQARLVAAKARLDTAAAALAREESLLRSGVSARRDVEAARSEVAAAKGEHEAANAALQAAGAGSGGGGRYALTAPIGGTIVARDAVIGRSATPGAPLMQVADLSTMWALLEVPEADAALVRPGQAVTLHFEGIRAPAREATISRVGAAVDPRTRTVRARVDLPNPDRALKAGLFVRATIQVSADAARVIVPHAAVQHAQGQAVVFVRENEAVYVPVPVELGQTTAAGIEVVSGLSPGVAVVTTGAFLLKTEILKESIGAGCCEEGGD